MNEEQWLMQNFKGDPCSAIADKLQAGKIIYTEYM